MKYCYLPTLIRKVLIKKSIIFGTCVGLDEFHINWRLLWVFSPTNGRHTYQLATSPICKMPYILDRIELLGLVGCALGFLGRLALLRCCRVVYG